MVEESGVEHRAAREIRPAFLLFLPLIPAASRRILFILSSCLFFCSFCPISAGPLPGPVRDFLGGSVLTVRMKSRILFGPRHFGALASAGATIFFYPIP